MSGDYLRIAEVGKILGVHPNTLRNWERSKKLVPKRDSVSRHRLYSREQIREFLLRGREGKLEVYWGRKYSFQLRKEELEQVDKTLDVIVSREATTSEKSEDKILMRKLGEVVARGVRVRFARDLRVSEMKERAGKMSEMGVETRGVDVAGVTVSVRDRKVVRIEVPSDNPEYMLNLVIADRKVARSFAMMFEMVWES